MAAWTQNLVFAAQQSPAIAAEVTGFLHPTLRAKMALWAHLNL
jgi:hypothetical protein